MTLPELHLADWRATKDTLHLYSQIVGKIRLATTAPRNHWWNVPLYVDVRGLTTRRLHHAARRSTSRSTSSITPWWSGPPTVAAGRSSSTADSLWRTSTRLHALLGELDIDVEIRELPFGVPMTTPFPQDHEHASWDRDAVERFGGSWTGPTRCSRSSAAGSTARRARSTCSGTASTSPSPASPAGQACRSTPIRSRRRPTRRRSSRSGSGPATTTSATPPTTPTPPRSPTGCATSRCRRASGSSPATARSRSSPTRRCAPRATRRQGLLAFCQSAYEAGARLAGWDTAELRVDLVPQPGTARGAPLQRRRHLRANEGSPLTGSRPVDSYSGRTAWARNLQSPLRAFLRTETGGAAFLLSATIGALVVGERRRVVLRRPLGTRPCPSSWAMPGSRWTCASG